MRLIVILLLLGVALASNVTLIDKDMIRFKAISEELEIMLNESARPHLKKTEKEMNRMHGIVHDSVPRHKKLHATIKKYGNLLNKIFDKIFAEIENNCPCRNDVTCQCCAKPMLIQTICLGYKIDKKNLSVSASLSWNDVFVANELAYLLSIKTPKVCLRMPKVSSVQFCSRLKDLSLKNKIFSGCLNLSVHGLLGKKHTMNITCFNHKV